MDTANGQFKEDEKTANGNDPVSLVIKEMQNKVMLIYFFPPMILNHRKVIISSHCVKNKTIPLSVI